jgi:hypothetical protein
MIGIAPKFSVTQDGVTMNIYHANKGEGLPKHEHIYAHLTMCFAGSVRITKENVDLTITKDDQPINLREREWHELEALEDGTVFVNVFAEGKY